MPQPPTSRRPLGHRVLGLLAVLVAIVASTATMAAVAPSSAGQPSSPSAAPAAPGSASGPTGPVAGTVSTLRAQFDRLGVTQHYAVPKPNCGAPAPGHWSCLSSLLVPATKGTPGAKAYTAPAYSMGPTGHGFTPADLASAYGYTPSAAVGASQTVAIVDAFNDPLARTELNVFDKQYGLPAETSSSFRKVNQSGKTSPLPKADVGWAGEIALDIEAVRGVCNKCHILLIEANSTDGGDLAAAVNTAARMGATEISNSYGGPETDRNGSTSDPAMLAAYNHPGIVITVSTGDDGWYGWDFANDPKGQSMNAAYAPSTYPTVVSVGGTALQLNSNGTRNKESVWNENGVDDEWGLEPGTSGHPSPWYGDQGASGGGCSTLYAAPSYQASAAGYAQLGCAAGATPKRSAADVAALADPYTGYDVYDSYAGSTGGAWVTAGGTSLSSPLIAAMWALAGGSGGTKYPAQNLYDHLRLAPSSIYDVTSGGNAFCAGDDPTSTGGTTNCSTRLLGLFPNSLGNPNNISKANSVWAGMLDCGYTRAGAPALANHQCDAATGFDGPSGIGTPRGLSVFKRMGPSISVAWPALIKPRTTATFRVAFSDSIPGAVATAYHWSWGDGTATTTTSATATHTFTAKGAQQVTVRVVDSAGRSQSRSKRYVVGLAPTVKASGSATVRKGSSGVYTANASDPDTGGRITAYTWRIGGAVVGRKAKMAHQFTSTGTVTVTVTVTDNSGLSTTTSVKTRVVSGT